MEKTCRSFLRSGSIRRVFLSGVHLILFFLAAAPSFSAAAPIITIIDDDARSVQAVGTVKDIADRCGIKVTFAAIAAPLERDPELVGLLRQYTEEGHEIASHSLTHSPGIWKAGAAADMRAIEKEMIESEEIFKRLELHPKAFVYPYGNFHRDVRHDIFGIVGKYYPVAFNARGDINLPGKTYPLYISRHPLRKHNSLFMMKRLVDQAAAADDAWIVILTHSANSDFSAEMLEDIIRYAQKSGAVFMTASAAWEQIRTWPMMREDQIPDYSRLGDYFNAAYFHLPVLLGSGIAFLALCCGMICLYVCRRRKKAAARASTPA